MTNQRYPLEPLLNVIDSIDHDNANLTEFEIAAREKGGKKLSDRRLAEIIGCDRRTITRWRNKGTLPWPQADRAAIALNLHPVLIWPEWLTTT